MKHALTPESLQLARNHFERLGLPVDFEIDPAALQSRYLEAARLTHPDLADADEESQVEAMEQSAAVNEAYRILSDPRRRGEYLLRLRGGASAEEDRSLPDGFLDRVLAIREQLAEAQMAGHKDTAAHVLQGVHEQESQRFAAISGDFREGTPDSLRRIRVHLNALRYLQRMLEREG
jgi:molecular chaperone HscB